METHNKKSTYISMVAIAIVAFTLGTLWHDHFSQSARVARGSHMMSDGTIMRNDGMMMGDTAHMSAREMMDSMNAQLEGKTGNDFDAAFLEQMIPHHQGAVAMAEMVLKTSKRPELIALANNIITSQQKEIEQMRTWQRTWFGVQPQ